MSDARHAPAQATKDEAGINVIPGEFATADGMIFYEIWEAQQDSTPDTPPPWITLIHNFMSTGRTAWGKIAPALLPNHRVLLMDLPGHGRSVGHPADFDYREMARQVADLMHDQGAEAGHVAGCSAGGMIAQWVMHEKWVVPASLTLISTTHSMNSQTAGAAVTTDPERFKFGAKWLDATAVLHDRHQGEGYFRRVILPAAGPRSPELTLDLPLAALESWSLPVCIIHGAEDEFFPVQVVQNMAEHFPHAELHIIPEQSHALIFRRPWQVAELMVAFLDEIDPKS